MEILAKYVYKVYEEQSITKAANKLFISQPALSAAVARHEKELGFRIFDRTTSPISLTPEGQIYIESLTDILMIEDERNRKIDAQANTYNQEVIVGGSSTVSYYLLPKICAAFQAENSSTQVKIDLGNVGDRDNLLDKLRNDKIDFFLEYVLPPFECNSTLLFEDELVIAVPDTIPINPALSQYALSYADLITGQHCKRVPDKSLFSHIPFPNYNIVGELLSNKAKMLLGSYTSSPLRVINSKNSIINHYLARCGCYAVMTTVNAAKHLFTSNDSISYYFISGEDTKRNVYLCSSASRPLTPTMQAFLQCAKNVCANNNP